MESLEAEEIGDFSLRSFRFPSYRIVGVLRMKSFKSSQAEVFRVSEVKETWSPCGCYF